MINVACLTFNPFSENTYVLWDETQECIIIDPGCYDADEETELAEFISNNNLKPIRVVLTHAHIDHVLGNKFVMEKYDIPLQLHKKEQDGLKQAPIYGTMWGINMVPSPEPSTFLDENDKITFGKSKLDIFFTPGHSSGSISLYSNEDNFVISGDVLFRLSIGRTDLPGGDFDTLITSIKTKLFTLPDGVKVYSGHGEPTTIGYEKQHNPFLDNRI